jgi:hypothetical protein
MSIPNSTVEWINKRRRIKLYKYRKILDHEDEQEKKKGKQDIQNDQKKMNK